MARHPPRRQYGAELRLPFRSEWRLSRVLSCLTVGVVLGILNVTFATSFAVLLFSVPLVGHVSWGIGLILFGAFMVGTVVALTSSYPGMIAAPQEIPVVILALATMSIANRMSGSAEAEEVFFTVAATIATTSLLTGMLFWTLGRFKLGNLVRFIPYPVVGGFLAGSGWLLIHGAMGVMLDTSLTFTQIPVLFQASVLVKWLPGFLFALLLLVVARRCSQPLMIPVLLLSSIGLFYLLLRLTQTSIAEASVQGWLLGPFLTKGPWQPLTLSALQHVHWSVIFEHMGSLVAILIIGGIALLFNASGLELTLGRDIDLNRELQSAGLANILAGFGGAPPGYQTLSDTTLGHNMGVTSRLPGLISAAFCGVTFLFGLPLLSHFPKPIAGSLFFFLGLSFLVEWLYDRWCTLPTSDYALIILILIIFGTFGFLEGVGAGVLVAMVLFVVKYSRINVIKHALSGVNRQSNVDRAIQDKQVLDAEGEQLYILALQGFIFFGTANNLLDQIRQRAYDAPLPPLRFVVFDFRLVSGLDASALHSFAKIHQVAESQHFTLVFVHLSSALRHQFGEDGHLTFDDLDHGLEYCEEQILAGQQGCSTDRKHALQAQLSAVLQSSGMATRVMRYVERLEVEQGCYLIRQGDAPKGIYFIESGQLTAQLEQEDGKIIRLRKMGAGTTVGELGLYVGRPASASVVTDRPSTIYYLSAHNLKRMEETEPEIAAAFHKFIAGLLGERLADTTSALQALLE